MTHYEMMFIVDPGVEETNDEIKQKIEGIITGREGGVLSFEKLGKKRLAYPVAKRQYGVYHLVNFTGDGRIVQALDYYLRLNPVILRHIILAFSEKDLRLRNLTERVQHEEAERMRLGGKPIGAAAAEEDATKTLSSTDSVEPEKTTDLTSAIAEPSVPTENSIAAEPKESGEPSALAADEAKDSDVQPEIVEQPKEQTVD